MRQQPQPRKSRWGIRAAADPAASRPTAPQSLPDLEARLDRLSIRASIEIPISLSAGSATTGLQVRHFKAAAIAVRRSAGQGARMVRGLCVPYGELIDLGDGRAEQFQFGCFRDSLAADDPRALCNGSIDRVLGRASAGTARFDERRDGLHFEADPPDCSWASDLAVSMERGDVSGTSCSFIVERSEPRQIGGKNVNVIVKAKLLCASVSAFSMFADANRATSELIENARAAGFRAGQIHANKAISKRNARAQRQGGRRQHA